jgi:two-component system heavy metal sensor histidine kinase CusS
VKSSLQIRLIVGIEIAVLMLLTVFSVGIYTVIRSALLRQFDVSLVSIAQVLAASVEIDGDDIELEFEVQQMPEFQDIKRPTYYQLWRFNGTTVAKSTLLNSRELPRLSGSLEKPAFKTIKDISGRIERAAGFNFVPRISDSENKATEKQALTLVVARDNTSIFSQLKLLRWVLFSASAAVILLSILVSALTVRQGLRPLTAIAGEIANIRENELTARVGAKDVPSELLPIKDRLNDLLSRLEEAFKRERRFTADVAHELRTPLAGIRSTLEVTLTRIRDINEYQASLTDCLTISKNMQRMVDNLLILARLDARQITFHRVHIELAGLASSCWLSFADRALEREIVFENHIPLEISCESDPENLSMIMSNLLDNAVEYANKGGRIWLTARQFDESIEVTISNTGCNLTSEQASHVFDCFWRSDTCRADTGLHCGLGLSLAQRIVKALGGSISAEVQPGKIFTIRLTIPNKSLV